MDLFPLNVRGIPRRTSLVGLYSTFFLRSTIRLLLPNLSSPLSWKVTIQICVFSKRRRISMNIIMFLYSLGSILPHGFLPITPSRTSTIRPLGLLFNRSTLGLSLTRAALDSRPRTGTRATKHNVRFQSVRITIFHVMSTYLKRMILPAKQGTHLRLLRRRPTIVRLLSSLRSLNSSPVTLAINVRPISHLLRLTLRAKGANRTLRVISGV